MLLNFDKTEKLLRKYDLPLSKSKVITSVEEAEGFNFPLVLKVVAPEVVHRTEKGLVKVGIESEEKLKKALEDLKEEADQIDSAQIIVQEQEDGLELIYGMKVDETFGPVLMFGLGGIFVEALKDVSFGITPVEKEEATRMINDIKGKEVLEGFRSYPVVNKEKAAEVLVKLSEMVEEEDLKEVNFNPVFAKEDQFKIADPKIIV